MLGPSRRTSNMTRRAALKLGGAGAALTGLLLVNKPTETRAQTSGDNAIVGAWMTHASSTTGGIQANLLAFTPGGVVMHAASNFPQSAGLGAWYDAGDGTIVYSLIYRRMDTSGAYIGSTRLNARVMVADDGNSYTSPYTTELTDPDGNVTATGQGVSHATRVVPTAPALPDAAPAAN
jgi:hypothetical protein